MNAPSSKKHHSEIPHGFLSVAEKHGYEVFLPRLFLLIFFLRLYLNWVSLLVSLSHLIFSILSIGRGQFGRLEFLYIHFYFMILFLNRVFLAKRKSDNVEIALKFISDDPTQAQEWNVIENFKQFCDIHLYSSLFVPRKHVDQTHIVQYYKSFTTEFHTVIEMEYCNATVFILFNYQ